jgi:alpha-glucoside transport system permease protein
MEGVWAAAVIVGAPAASVAYISVAEGVVSRLDERRQRSVRPWLWAAPALIFVGVFLVYPMIATLVLSFEGVTGRWVGPANYRFVFGNPDVLAAFGNNFLWLVGFTGLTVAFGLLIAVLSDRVRYGVAALAIVFLPMALSFTAAGVTWKFMYEYHPAGTPQIGTLNAALIALAHHFQPRAWLIWPPLNTVLLVVVGVWIWTGFSAIVLSAAIKGVPGDLLDAARVDGARETRVLCQIVLPTIAPTIAVLATTMVITALKVFDVVYVMTNGNFGTEVIADRMYKEMFLFQQFGRAGALAIILLLATVPIMGAAVRRLWAEEAVR